MTSQAGSINWGHLLTGTTESLQKKEKTVGLHLLAYGITDSFTVGIIPWAYLSYDFNNIFLKYNFYNKKNISQTFDFIYLDSKSSDDESIFDQTSYWGRYNIGLKHSERRNSYLSLGLQYYTKDNSPHSLRGDPKGKFNTLGIKGSKDLFYYEDKLQDYKKNKRDPKTISLSYIFAPKISDSFLLNLEYGQLGMNYDYPFEHIGVSLIYRDDRQLAAFGWSRSQRYTPHIGTENVYHPELKYQYTF
jgi:hypothetical protein